MADVNKEQVEFAYSLLKALHDTIDENSGVKPQDDFETYLVAWAIVLGVLAVDSFRAILTLLRDNQVRASYMLSRTLIDYHVRLRYYVKDARPIMDEWRKAKNAKILNNQIARIAAYQDFNNALTKTLAIFKQGRPLDLSKERPENRDAFEKAMEEAEMTYSRNVKYMCEQTAENKEIEGWMYTTHLLQSGYMHGDQTTRIEILEENPDGSGQIIHWDSRMSA